jgi:hypothetical protein
MSLVTWNRIEPIIDAETVDTGLAAPLADPLWLLGRQWQIGELTAEDAGSPIGATIATTAYPLDRITIGAQTHPLDAKLPLEALVEPEPPTAPDLRMRLAAGRDLIAALANKPVAIAALAAFRPAAQTDRNAAALISALGPRAVDGELVAAQIAQHGVAAVATTLGDATVVTALTAWNAAYQRRTGRAGPSAWNEPAARYQFSLRATVGTNDIVLAANDYRGGTLDWCDFDATTAAATATEAPIKNSVSVLPVPLEFSGGPARRFFELERGGASYGALVGTAPDLGTAMLVEVTLVFGGDWFVAPVSLPVGALGRVDTIVVTDSFGGTTTISNRLRSPNWRMFECGSDPSVADFLAIVPTVSAALEGPAIEVLVLGRDESANAVWAIEDVVCDPLGLPVLVDHAMPPATPHDTWTYEPLVAPPPGWYPLVRRDDAFVGAALRPVQISASPRGRLLASFPAVGFLTDDVPSEGLTIERRWQFAIAADGTRALWITRAERIGRGSANSGVLADQLRSP